MDRLTGRGKYLFDGERKFFARGVSYGPFAPNLKGERYPEPDRVRADFALMREFGANLLRCYVPPPDWMIEEAGRAELRLMVVGIPWPFHMAFLDSPQMVREIRETIRKGVLAMRKFGGTIAAYSLGNEVRSISSDGTVRPRLSVLLRNSTISASRAIPRGSLPTRTIHRRNISI